MNRIVSGQRFGRWTTIKSEYENKRTRWICRCDCGNIKKVSSHSLNVGTSKSCGCLRKEITGNNFRKHGKPHKRLYAIWSNMRSRCRSHKNYSGRGITICEEWDDFTTFLKWSLTHGYKDDLTIDRIDNDGNYEPENCRWSNDLEQMNNTSRNIFTTIDGVTKTLSEHARDNNINYFTLQARHKSGIRGSELIAPLKVKTILIKIDGEVRSLKEWSEKFNFSYSTIRHRFNKGVRGIDLFAPVDPIMSENAKKRKEVI